MDKSDELHLGVILILLTLALIIMSEEMVMKTMQSTFCLMFLFIGGKILLNLSKL